MLTMRYGLGALAAALLALGLAGCGGDSEGIENEIADDPITTTEPQPSPGDAAAVCEGGTNDSAPNYDQGAGTVAVYEKPPDGGDYEYRSYAGELPDGTEAVIPSDASLVVCLDVKSSESVDVCTYEDSDSGEEFTVEIASATFDAIVYEANSGTEVDSAKNLEGTVSECPAAASFTEGETSKVDYAEPTEDLKSLLEPLTQSGT